MQPKPSRECMRERRAERRLPVAVPVRWILADIDCRPTRVRFSRVPDRRFLAQLEGSTHEPIRHHRLVAPHASVSRSAATSMVDAVFSSISDALAQEETAAIAGFGTFVVKQRPVRQGGNPGQVSLSPALRRRCRRPRLRRRCARR